MITITDKEFKQLSIYIKEHYGINLKDEKRILVTGRLQNELIQRGFKNFTEYYNYIMSDNTENAINTLINKITTNHTFFMREPDHFNYFRDHVLPFLKSTVKGSDLRLWSAGCSSGEEPYTLTMLIDEFFGKEKVLWDTKVLATDISSVVLEKGKNGVYRKEDLSDIPHYWKMNYFKKFDDENYILINKIRNEVIYRRFNLMEERYPFKKRFHVIFCRNVMIYFDSATKRKLVKKFYDSLEYGGYLFIGHSESIAREDTKFKYIMPAIYRKE